MVITKHFLILSLRPKHSAISQREKKVLECEPTKICLQDCPSAITLQTFLIMSAEEKEKTSLLQEILRFQRTSPWKSTEGISGQGPAQTYNSENRTYILALVCFAYIGWAIFTLSQRVATVSSVLFEAQSLILFVHNHEEQKKYWGWPAAYYLRNMCYWLAVGCGTMLCNSPPGA